MGDSNEDENVLASFPYKDIYFLGLQSQSNVYCCTTLQKSRIANGEEKLLISSLRGTVSCVECKNEKMANGQKPTASEVYFTYIPGDAEIISMDAFSRNEERTDFMPKEDSIVIAISLILAKVISGVKKCQHFLNIYKAMEPEQRTSLKDIARGCQHIELYFTPFHLIHASIFLDESFKDKVFLLSGSDKKVHLFKENEEKQRFEECDIEEYFPEFADLPSSVIWMEIRYCQEDIRMTAFGCQNGFVKVTAMDRNSDELKCYTLDVGGLVTSVRLFSLKNASSNFETKLTRSEVSMSNKKEEIQEHVPSCEELSLLLTCAMELSVVYLNIYSHGFDDMVVLPQSDHFDSVVCSAVTDFDLDGHNEILLGTYGQELLVYKSYRSSIQNEQHLIHFDLHWTKSFPRPLFAIKMVDLTKNGLRELAVVSLNGVHVLQFNVEEAASIILRQLTNSSDEHKESDAKLNFDAVCMSPIIEENSP